MAAGVVSALARLDAALGLGLPASADDRLRRFEVLLRERALPYGLIAETDSGRIWERHVLDCLRAAAVVEPTDRAAYDLGSGAGLPGVVVAIARPGLEVLLVESRRRRAAFLELAAEQLELPNVTVVGRRVEDLGDRVDLCFARALAPLQRSWAMARRLLRPGGRLVYFAGRGSRAPERLLGAVSIRLLETSVLERSGPLVIMTQQ